MLFTKNKIVCLKLFYKQKPLLKIAYAIFLLRKKKYFFGKAFFKPFRKAFTKLLRKVLSKKFHKIASRKERLVIKTKAKFGNRIKDQNRNEKVRKIIIAMAL